MKKFIPLIFILLTSSYLMLNNLGNQFLWQDEAETALLARNTLKYGFPRAYDGKNLINPSVRTGYSPNYGWRYHPWGQFYITAASFMVLGEGTFRARLPFAITGIFNIFLAFLLAYRTTKDIRTANITALLTSLSVPFILLMRQCRYYAPSVFLILCVLLIYDVYLKKRSYLPLLGIGFSLALLGHTVHGMYLPVLAAVALHFFLFGKNEKPAIPFLCACAASFLLVLPWFIYSNSGAHVAAITLERLRKNFEFQIRMINKYIMPFFFLLGMYPLRGIWKKRWSIFLTDPEKNTLKLIGPVILMSIAAFCFAQERNLRYLVYFIPLLAIVQALVLVRLLRFNKYMFSVFLALSLFTNVFNMGKAEFLLPKYIYEITHDYDGPIEGIVRFFWEKSEKLKYQQTVKISYGDMPLMFYTDFKVDNSRVFDKSHMPEWIVFRRWWDGEELLESAYFREVQKTYKKHVLAGYPDIPWENRPGDLGYHRFTTDKSAPGVIIFEKK